MNILVTNDDGIDSPGLRALADGLADLGRVVVVAPDRERSACSHSLTLRHPLRIREIETDRYAVDGTPADCVNVAVNGLLEGERPGLIVSGINLGVNVGDDTLYSGTVAAAEEGAIIGIPSIAASIDAVRDCHFETPVFHVKELAGRLLENGPPERCYYNLNAPNLPRERVKGARWTRLGIRIYHDVLETRTDPRGERYFWIGGEAAGMREVPGSDMAALAEGYVSITPLRLDRTDERVLRSMDPGYGKR